MKIATQGTKADLGFTAKQLKEMVEDHGGTIVTKVDESTDALVASAKETEKKKPTAKVAAARKHQVGIVTIDWLLTVCNELSDEDDDPEKPAKANQNKKKTKKSEDDNLQIWNWPYLRGTWRRSCTRRLCGRGTGRRGRPFSGAISRWCACTRRRGGACWPRCRRRSGGTGT